MSSTLRVLVSTTRNPWFNLATEDWLFRGDHGNRRTSQVLFLWRNDPTVVIGRHQNPWVECDPVRMQRDGVLLARRQSGGGAVYHDPGNLNFTFISDTAVYDRDVNFHIVVQALASVGVPATRSDRNDILVSTPAGRRKISGNAFKHTRDRCFHHGTILVEADLGRLTEYLRPAAAVVRARGTKSVRSPVINIREIAPECTIGGAEDALIRQFMQYHDRKVVPEHLNEDDLGRISTLLDYYQEMRSWEWRFGATPEFTHRVFWTQPIGAGGTTSATDVASSTSATTEPTEHKIPLELTIDRGVITKVVLHCENGNSDVTPAASKTADVSAALVASAREMLVGSRYDETSDSTSTWRRTI